MTATGEIEEINAELQENSEKNDKGTITQFLTFLLGDEEYGINIMEIREIRVWTETTRLPNSPKYVLGVINLRGVVIPIFDLRKRFGMKPTDVNDKSVVIVLSFDERMVGVLVDAVSDILDVGEQEIKPAPPMERIVSDDFLTGLISKKDRMVVLLNIEGLFDKDDLEVIAEKQIVEK